MAAELNPDEFRVAPGHVLDKYDQYHVQPALFDESEGGDRYNVSEAVRGLTALGTPTGWRSMGQKYVNGKRLVIEDEDGSV
jgi:hypothetical protein